MKRKFTLVLAILLLLSSVGCGQAPVRESTEPTVDWATEETHSSTQPQTQSRPQEETLSQNSTERTEEPTVQPTQSMQPDHPDQPTQPTQSTQPDHSTQPTQSTQPDQPTQPTQPDHPTQPIQPTQLTQPDQPNQPTQPTQPTQSTQPNQPTQSIQVTQSTQSTQPTQPTQPAQNNNVQNTQPTQATQSNATTPAPKPTQAQTTPTTKPEEVPTTIPATEKPTDPGCNHDYQQTYTKAATCTTEGSKKFTCRKCGAVMRQQIPMKAHSYADATCLKPKTCTACSHTEGTALGHSYGENHRCIRCNAKDPGVSPESMPVNFVATIRSDEGVSLSGITVTVYTTASGSNSAGSAVTDKKGMATIALSAGSSNYTIKLSNVPEQYQFQSSYSFTGAQVTINLKTLPVRTDPNDHSKARYEEGDKMMEFTMTDVDGRTYRLSELLQDNKLIILDFWYVSCNPCKQEFPYFEAALQAYGDDVVILAVDPFYSASDIGKLRDEMGLSFPLFQDALGLSGGFRVETYPTTVFIDSTGTIQRIHRNSFSDEASFLRAIAAYL